MATLYIAELESMSRVNGMIPVVPPVAEQAVTITGTSAQSSAFNSRTRFLRVNTDAACHVLVGKSPTATTGKWKLAAGQTEYFQVDGGHKIAVIAAA